MAGEVMTETQRTRLVNLLTRTSHNVDEYLTHVGLVESPYVEALMKDHEELLDLVDELTGIGIDWDSGLIVTDKE